MARQPFERAMGMVQVVVLPGFFKDGSGLFLKSLDLIGNNLKFGAHPCIDHLVRLFDLAGQVNQGNRRRKAAHWIRGAMVRPGMFLNFFIFPGFLIHGLITYNLRRYPVKLKGRVAAQLAG